MESFFFGHDNRPAIAIVGTWDPFTSLHKELVQKAAVYANLNNFQCVTIAIHPNPASYLQVPPHWVNYDDLNIRIALLRKYGSDSVILIKFELADLNAGAEEFFDVVLARVTVRELWLGKEQSLGTGHRGCGPHLDKVASTNGVKIVRLSLAPSKQTAARARFLLASGDVEAATKVICRPPVWDSYSENLRTACWPAGDYLVKPFDVCTEQTSGASFKIHLLQNSKGLLSIKCKAILPLRIAFLYGPKDILSLKNKDS